MEFSLNEIRRLTGIKDKSDEEIISKLTMCGFEVENSYSISNASKLTTGLIMSCSIHPDSNHLHILKVDCGKKHGILQIVCGAKNAREGIKVIVALPGCSLPSIGKTIEKSSIRGVESFGMCCSLLELGVNSSMLEKNSTSLDGIEELDDKIKIGDDDILNTLNLKDTMVDINVLPNRPDCLSYIGISREILSEFKIEKNITFTPFDKNKYKNKDINLKINTKYCPRADIVSLSNVIEKKSTPEYVQKLLLKSQIHPISPIVDLGNYVMLITGQPVNMYDLDKNPKKIFDFRSDIETNFESFDNKSIQIKENDIVITDDERILCLAGITAGKNTMIDRESKNIAIEFANFYHANIRRTSNRVGISTSSSLLFSKGRNGKLIDESISFMFSVINDFLESYTISSYASKNNEKDESKLINFSLNKLNSRLGTNYTKEYVSSILKAYRIEEINDKKLKAPIDRVDLIEQCDIDEEIFRNSNISDLNLNLSGTPITFGQLDESQKEIRNIKNMLSNLGFNEILSFTLISKDDYDLIKTFDFDDPYTVLNPMTKDHEIVRTSLLPSMIDTLKRNISYQNNNLALYEISHVDTKKGTKLLLSIGLNGKSINNINYDFFYLKGILENIFRKLGISENRLDYRYSANTKFHPTCSSDIYMNKNLICTFGKINPLIFDNDFLLCEIDIGYLLEQKRKKTKFKSFSNTPVVTRDLSIKINDEVSFLMLKTQILKLKDTYIKDVLFFDTYMDESGKYLGISLLLSKDDETLKDEEINSSVNKVVSLITNDLNLSIRGKL